MEENLGLSHKVRLFLVNLTAQSLNEQQSTGNLCWFFKIANFLGFLAKVLDVLGFLAKKSKTFLDFFPRF